MSHSPKLLAPVSLVTTIHSIPTCFNSWANKWLFTVLSLDVVDSSGEQQFAVEHNVFKQRLDLQGNMIEEAEKDTINKQHNTTSEEPATESCESCYGAKEGCCNTCADVREAYRQKVYCVSSSQLQLSVLIFWIAVSELGFSTRKFQTVHSRKELEPQQCSFPRRLQNVWISGSEPSQWIVPYSSRKELCH